MQSAEVNAKLAKTAIFVRVRTKNSDDHVILDNLK